MTRLSIDISDELHHLLKVHTAWTKSNIRDFVTEAIHNKIEFEKEPRISKNIPNAETIKAFEDSAKGIGVTRFASVEDMFNDLYKELEDEGFKVKRHA